MKQEQHNCDTILLDFGVYVKLLCGKGVTGRDVVESLEGVGLWVVIVVYGGTGFMYECRCGVGGGIEFMGENRCRVSRGTGFMDGEM